jgi:hypothetical protein
MTASSSSSSSSNNAYVNPMKRGGGHDRNVTQLPTGWGKDMDGDGNKFYYSADGAVQWEKPPGSVGGSGSDSSNLLGESHVRSETELPIGWGKDMDADGNKYYYNKDGSTSWEAPPGSTGGSSSARC